MHALFEKKLIPTKEAAELSGYTSDYIARLARSGKIAGRRVGHTWFVDTESLGQFLSEQEDRKIDYARALARARETEYRAINSPLNQVVRTLAAPLRSAPKAIAVATSFRSHAVALGVALFVVSFGAVVAQAAMIPNIAGRAAALTSEIAFGFAETFGGIPARVVAHVEKVKVDAHVPMTRVAEKISNASTDLAFVIPAIDLDAFQMPIGGESRSGASRVVVAAGVVPTHTGAARTIEDVRTSVQSAYDFVMHPSRAADSLVDAYLALGTRAYASITTLFTGYRSLIDHSGVASLSLATSLRDTLADTPRLVSQMNLAFGTAIINATHAAIRAEVGLAYAGADAAPRSARAVVAFMGEAGDVLERAAGRVPALAISIFRGISEVPAAVAPKIASTVFDAEYAAATHFVAITHGVTTRYGRIIEITGEVAHAGATGSIALGQGAVSLLEKAPATIEDTTLAILGKSARTIESLTDVPDVSTVSAPAASSTGSALAALAPRLSSGEVLALFVYKKFSALFDSTTSSLARLFAAPAIVVLPDGSRKSTHLAVGGTSASLASFRSEILNTVAGMIRANSNLIPVVNNYNTYTTVQRGGGGGGGGGGGNVSAVVSDPLTLNTLTINSALTVAGTFAVSGTGTSTFAGAIDVAGLASTSALTTSSLTLNNLTGSTRCLHVDANGIVSATPGDCGSGSGGVSTSSPEVAGQIPYWTTTSGSQAQLGTVGTTTLSLGANLSYSGTLGSLVGGTSGTLSIATSTLYGTGTGGQVLAWNNGVPNWVATSTLATITGTLAVGKGGTGLTSLTQNALLYSNSDGTALAFAATSSLNIGGNAATATALQTARTINGVAFDGTANITVASTTLLTDSSTFSGNNTFSGTNTFSTVPTLGTLSGLIAGNNGTLYQTASSTLYGTGAAGQVLAWNNGQPQWVATSSINNGVTSVSGTWPIISSGGFTPTLSFGGLSTSTAPVQGNIPYFSSNTTFANVATSTLSLGANLSYSGTLGSLVGGTSGTLSIATSTLYGTGTGGQVLAWNNGVPNWVATSTLATITGTLAQSKGGTGITTYAQGDILYADLSGNLQKLPHGNTGEVLKISAGLPAWGTDLTTGGGGGDGAWSTTTDSLAVYVTDTTDVIIIGSSATSTPNSIFEVVGRSYFSTNVGIGTTSPGSLLSVGNTNGINFSTATSTFNSTGGINLSAGCYAIGGTCLSLSNFGGTLGVANGGTGVSSLSANQLTYTNAAGTALTTVATSTLTLGSNLSYSGTLGSLVGGTSGTLSIATSTLYGTGTGGQVLTWNNGQPQWVATSSINNGVSSLQQLGGGSAQTGAITFATSSNSSTGLTAGLNITNTAGAFTFAPTLTGTLNVANGGTGNISFTSSQLVYGNGTAALSSVATSTRTYSGPFTVTGTLGAQVGGTNSTIVWTGLATTTQPSSSNLLVSNGAAGVYGVATSTLTASGGLTGSFTQLGSGGSLSLATINAGVLGAVVNGAVPTSQATSTLYGTGIGGRVLGWDNTTGGLAFIATSTSVTAVTGTWPIISSGGTTPNLTWGGISTSSPISAGGAVLYATGVNTFASIATTTYSVSGPFTVTGTMGALVGGTNSTIVWTGLATTSQPSSSNLLVSNGTSGVYGVATTSATLGLGLSGTLTTLGSSQSLSIATSSLFTGTTGQFPYFSGTNTLVGTSSIFVATNQRIGVGTTTPWGQFSINPNGLSGPAFVIGSSTGTKFIVNSAGQVGVGTTSPGADLDITDLGTNVLSGWNGNLKLNGPGNPSAWFHDTTNNIGSFIGHSNGITSFGREVSGSFTAISMIVDSNGNLRVGASTAASYKFDVVGLGHFSGLVDAANFVATSTTATSTFAGALGVGTTTPWQRLSVHGNALVSGDLSIANLIATGTAKIGSLNGFLAANGGTLYQVSSSTLLATSSLFSGTTGQFPYFSGTNTITATSSLFVSTAGNIGVGTVSPSAKLHVVNGTAGAFTPVTDETVVLQRNGNASDNAVLTIVSGTSGASIIRLTDSATEQGKLFYDNSVDAFGIFTNGSEKLRIDSVGKMGIGSTTPWAQLSINPTAANGSAPSFVVGSSTGTKFIIDNTGKVGIGNANPGTQLDVTGSIRGDSLVLTSSSTAYSTLTSVGGFNGYVNTSGGFGTGGNDSVLASQRISAYGNLVNIGSVQAGELNISSGGTFVAKTDYSTASNPEDVAAGDLNGDGKTDIVAVNVGADSASVFLNNGNGTFATKVDYTTGSVPRKIILGDVNGDGKADLIVANNASTISVLRNNGNGTFATKVDYTAGTDPKGIVAGDVNGDGKIDIIVSNNGSNNVSVLLNNGNGTFATRVNYTTDTGPYSVALGDVNGDGRADIATANYTASTASVLINNGNGTFATKADYTTGTNPYSVALGDVNGDGKADLIAGNEPGSASVLLNNGAGTFAAKVDYTTGTGIIDLTLADVSGDGKADIVTANFADATASILINNGNGTFATNVDYGTGSGPYGIAVGDFNTDGKVDIVTANTNADTISVLLNKVTPSLYAQGSTGNLSIGTTSPYSKLSIQNAYGSSLALFDIASTTAINGTATSSLFRINANGNVGIGSTTPWGQLSINPTAANGSAPSFVIGSSTGTKFIVNNAGNVGIGTASPTEKLMIYGSAAGANSVRTSITNTSGAGYADMFLFNDAGKFSGFQLAGSGVAGNFVGSIPNANLAKLVSDASNFVIGTQSGGGEMEFLVGGSEAMRINTSGKIGIGTTSPYANLSVTSGTGNTSFAIGSSTTNKSILSVNSYGDLTASQGDAGLVTIGALDINRSFGGVWIGETTPNTTNYTLLSDGASTYFNADTGHMFFRLGNSDKITINASGNTGFGSTTPWGQLSINPTAANGSAPSFVIGSSTGTKFIVDNAGNVGIGTTTPRFPLEIARNIAGAGLAVTGSVAAGEVAAYVNNTDQTGYTAIRVGSSAAAVQGFSLEHQGSSYTIDGLPDTSLFTGFGTGGLVFRAWNTSAPIRFIIGTSAANEKMRIDSNGNVGIGTTTPGAKLDVFGAIRGQELVLTSSSTAYSILSARGGFNGYVNTSGGFGTGGNDSILANQRISAYGNLVNIGSVQAGELNITSGGTFAAKTDYTTGSGPISVVTADVNGDGKADIVVVNSNSATASVFINNGDGTFATKVDYTTGTKPNGIALADVNGDGKADFVTANYNSGSGTSASVLINNGNGTFATKVDYTLYSYPANIALADVNGDGKADIVAVSDGGPSSNASVLINNGDGNFATKVDYPAGFGANGVALADVNGDGKTDIVTANTTAIAYVLINNGNGTFATKVDYTVGSSAIDVALADVNGDGKADIVTANYSGTSVSVLLNKATPSLFAQGSTGNLSIGTTSPYAKLSIQNAYGSSLALFDIASTTAINGTATSSLFRINANGNVGIGTTTPGSLLSIGGQGTGTNFFDNATTTKSGVGGINIASGCFAINGTCISGSGGGTNYFTNSGASTYLSTGTNLGVGTSSPYATLSVTPALGATPFAVASSTGFNLFSLNKYGAATFGSTTSSNIFINGGGTTTPTFAAGNNVAIGNQAFSYYTTSAQYNNALGTQALYGSSTAPMAGSGNNAFGNAALYSNTTGYQNNALGGNALHNNTDGYNNNALGQNSLYFNTTGSSNNALGSGALRFNTTGSYNNALGDSALNSNTTGSSNNALGYIALYNNTTGSYNSAIGDFALTLNTTGSYNNALGYQSLHDTTTGSYNNALGHSALNSNTTGNFNTAIGYQALFNTTTGYDNIMIGHVRSVGGGNNITTGFNNIAFGYNAGIGTSTNSTNFLNIGNSFFGSMIATTSATSLPTDFTNVSFAIATSSLLGNTTFAVQNAASSNTVASFFSKAGASLLTILDNGNVGVGTSSPYAKLSVAGEVVARNFTATSTTATSTFAGGFSANSGNIVSDFSSGLTSIQNLLIGALSFDTDAGQVAWFDMPVTSAASAGTVESYSAQIDGSPILTVYAESDGSGGIRNSRVGIGSTTPWGQLSINPTAANGSAPSFVVGSSTATKFIIDNAGRVGIGSTTPGSLLSIGGQGTGTNFFDNSTTTKSGVGGINIASGCYAVNGTCISGGGGGSGTVGSGTTGQFPYYAANGTTLSATSSLFLATSGYIGIGTTTPSARLDVTGRTGGDILSLHLSSGLQYGYMASDGSLYLANNGSGSYNFQVGANGGLTAAFATIPALYGNTNFVDGNVGVGTSSPYARLSVVGEVVARNFTATSTTATSTFMGGFRANSDAIVSDLYTGVTSIASLNLGATAFDTDGGVLSWVDMPVTSAASSGTVESYTAHLNGNAAFTVYGQSNGSGGLLIGPRVGIASSTPGSLFSIGTSNGINFSTATSTFSSTGGINLASGCFAINGTCISGGGGGGSGTVGSGTTGQFPYYAANGTTLTATSTLFLATTGNVGIGTTAPGVKFQVTGADGGEPTLGTASGSGAILGTGGLYGLYFGQNGGTGASWIQSMRNDSATSYALNLQPSGGNVGIGTSTPWGQLSINPTAANGSAPSFVVGSSTGTKFIVNNAGNVGIGTASPSQLLEISGASPRQQITATTNGNNAGLRFTALDSGGNSRNAGVYYSNSGAGVSSFIGFSADDTSYQLTIHANGNVGIGTTSPYAMLSVAGQVVANNFIATSTTATSTFAGGFSANSGGIVSDLYTGITSISNLSIGATAFEADAGVLSWVDLPVTSASAAGVAQSYTAQINGNPLLTVYAESDGTGGIQNARVGVGTSTPSKAFAVQGTVALKSLGTGTGGNYLCIDTTTWEVLRGNGSSCTASSLKFKENVQNLQYGLADVMNLRPVSYNYKAGTNMGDGVKLGFIAEEMDLVIPEVVTHDNHGNIFGLDYPLLTSVLTSAVQQLNGKVDSLASSTISIQESEQESSITNASTVGGKLMVSGGVFASGYETLQGEVASFTLGSTTVVGALPSSVLTANGVDIYKLATYNLSGITALAAALEAHETRIVSLESRVALLESGAIAAASASPFSTTSLIAALDSFGAFIKSGLAQFGTLIADQFVAASNSAGTASAGTVNVLSGNTVAQVNNAYVLPTTKVFVTFNSELEGTWYVSEKQAGSFRVVLSEPQSEDVSFDYFLVQTEGQFQTSTATSTDTGVTIDLSGGSSSDDDDENVPPSGDTPPPPPGDTPPAGDTEAPVVTLLGDAAMEIVAGDTFTDAGATATDNVDGDLTSSITISGTVDTATPGLYSVTYSAVDVAGNTGSASRLVSVVAAPAP